MIDDALKVTSWFGERDRVEDRFFSDVLLDAFAEHDVSTSVLLRATGGFGLAHHLRGDRTLTLSEDPSVVATAVDTPDRLAPLVPRIAALQPRGLLTVERAGMVGVDGLPAGLPEQLSEATKLTVQVGRHHRVGRVPAYVAVCELLREHGIAGASVLVGVDGTRAGVRERARFFDRNTDVPTTIVAVGEGERIRGVHPELVALLQQPHGTIERVRVCKRDGELLARPHALPATDESGLGLWQKLTVYTSESQLHDGEPVHRGILRRLRATDTRGATALRGIWGFHGDHAPHGDRFWQLGRRVPVVTIVVDTPARIVAAFDVVDEMTREHGLVTSEMVPALRHLGPGTDPRTDGEGLRLAHHEF